MGQNSSSTQATSDVFSSDEVQRLEKRFKKLDSDASGSISIAEFISIPELKENPLGSVHLIFSRILNLRIKLRLNLPFILTRSLKFQKSLRSLSQITPSQTPS